MTNNSLRISQRVPVAVILATLICLVAHAQQPAAPDEKSEETKTGSITGTVVNDNGQPLAGAAVFVRPVNSLGQGRTTTTDSEGNFQVKGLDPTLYTVGARIPAYVSPPRDPDDLLPLTYYRVGDSLRLVQIKGGVITGTVTNSSGEPVVKVGVRAFLIRDANGQPPKFGIAEYSARETDDRGVYRLYGLTPGTYLVSAGGSGNGSNSFSMNAYDNDAPTYAPSATRDTATEITVRAGDEASSVDIRYRGEPGRVVSGTANGPIAPGGYSSFFITLTAVSSGTAQLIGTSFQPPGSKGFAFSGVVDGDYELIAQSQFAGGEATLSDKHRITVKGADVTGIELTTRPLPSIAGRVTLESSKAPECKGKRRPLFAETLVTAARNEKDASAPAGFARFVGSQTAPDRDGAFTLRNVQPGQYNMNTRFFAKYWYLQSILLQPAVPPAAKRAATNQPIDAARNWTTVKPGDRVGDLNITLSEGAASLSGQLTIAEGQKPPSRLVMYLVPAEREKADDVLRFFVTPVTSDGNFALNNLAPGRYWLLMRGPGENASVNNSKLRLPDEGPTRSKLRRDAEAAKTELELKPCQNITDYQLPWKLSTAEVRDSLTAP